MLARRCCAAGRSARMRAVTAYPVIGPSSENSARISEDRLPASRGRTLKVSIAFATVGRTGPAERRCGWMRVALGFLLGCSYLIFRLRGGDCFVAALLAMTNRRSSRAQRSDLLTQGDCHGPAGLATGEIASGLRPSQ